MYDVMTFQTFQAPNATNGASGYVVKKWRDNARAGMWVEVSVTRAWKQVAVNAANLNVGAYLIADAPTNYT